MKYSGAEFIISESGFHSKIVARLAEYDCRITEFDIDTKFSFEYGHILNDEKYFLPPGDTPGDDVYILLHTSDTLFEPKRDMLSHKNVIINIRSLDMGKDERTLIVLPMFFGYCNISQFLTHLYLGGKPLYSAGYFTRDISLRR